MTKSLTKDLFTPFKDPKREFRSSRKHFKALSLDESRSPDFDLFSDQEEYSEEEVAETMELRDNTFSGLDHEDANEHIEKVLEIVDLFHIPNIIIDQVMLRAFPMSLIGALDRFLIQEEPYHQRLLLMLRQPSKKWLNTLKNGIMEHQGPETSNGLAAVQAQLNNLGREIKKVNEKVYAAQVRCEQWSFNLQNHAFMPKIEPGDGVTSYTRRRHNSSSDGITSFHDGFSLNTIELLVGNNVVPLRSDIIRLVQNGCSFHGLRSEDPNQHLKDFLKHVDSLDLDGENRERTRLRLFQFSLRDQASNCLERLPAGSITTWEDLTTRFLAQFFPPGRTVKLHNDILMFQQHHGESISKAWTRFKDLLQKVPHHGIDLWLQVQIFYDHVNPVRRRTIDQSASDKLRDHNAEESWALLEDLALYDNESWNDPRDFAKPVKAITLPQDVPSTSDHRDHRKGLEVDSIRRIQGLEMAYWGFLGVGTTLDIFQNIIFIPY
ncbi:zinc finger, CCHC-type containing protein [Tanacetum coccineum]